MKSRLIERAQPALRIAADHAADVDRQGRFPAEAIAALKEARLLGAMIPEAFGGDTASLAEIADLCAELGRCCSSTAMIFAMHQIKVSSLVSHGQESAWHRAYMRRTAQEQLLLASATTEGGGIGGNMRNSNCAVERDGERFTLVKDASVISYGRYADAILVTARSSREAPASDQVMAVILREQYRLDQTGAWDALGMRGTCSEGFKLAAEAPVEQIFPVPFADIAAHSMLAIAHILWSSLWYGIAADAVQRAQKYMRGEARKTPGQIPPAMGRVTHAIGLLNLVNASVRAAIERFEASRNSNDLLDSVAFGVDMNTLKLTTSRLVNDILHECLMVTGISGYRNDSPFSIGRHMRDVMSAPLMVNNDRIAGNTANMVLMHRVEHRLAS